MSLQQIPSPSRSNYPGDYQPPLYNWQATMRELKAENFSPPHTNICDMPGYVKIEIAAPGHKKQDFMASIEGRELVITVLQSKKDPGGEEYTLREFDCTHFTHSVTLPPYTDADFVKAEYNDGILSFFFSKTRHPADSRIHRVVVY